MKAQINHRKGRQATVTPVDCVSTYASALAYVFASSRGATLDAKRSNTIFANFALWYERVGYRYCFMFIYEQQFMADFAVRGDYENR